MRDIVLGYDPTVAVSSRGTPFAGAGALSQASFTIDPHFLAFSWLIGSILTAVVLFYRDSTLLAVFLRREYAPLRPADDDQDDNMNEDDRTLKPRTDVTPRPVYASPQQASGAAGEAFDMFDPADLPPRLSEYANMVYSACEDLGNFFGFQDSSVRNQAEHLLILLSNHRRYMNVHILPVGLQPPSPIHALHAKVFSNYMKWCRYHGVAPHFSKMSGGGGMGGVATGVGGGGMMNMAAPPSVASRVVDLVLFFCIWGEAGNIRHMPECLWFLYHKMMEEYSYGEMYGGQGGGGYGAVGGGMVGPSGGAGMRSLYAGHFLDYVVTPIYKVVSAVSDKPSERK